MIRLATIGTNFIVDRFLECIPYCEELEHTAVYSRSMERGKAFAKKYGIEKVYDHIEELAEDESIDAVYIASPNNYHFQHAMMLLNYGKHVLCEKPVASNKKELEMMMEAARENQVIFLEAMKNVFTPGFAAVEENLSKLGTIRKAEFQVCKYSSRYDHFKEGIIENAFKPSMSNGALMDLGCYGIQFLVKLFGRPLSIQADAVKLDNDCDGAGTILMHYQEMQASVSYSKITDSYVPSQIQGEKGSMLIQSVSNPEAITIHYRDGKVEEIEVFKHEGGKRNLIFEALEFEKLIKTKQVEHPHNEYSVRMLEVMDEARRQMGIRFPADKIMEV